MTSFEELITQFSRESGINVAIDDGNSITLESEGIVVTARYDKENGMLTIFAPVTDMFMSDALTVPVLRAALKLSFNGAGTFGNFLGLVENTLWLSNSYPLSGLDAESFAGHLIDMQSAAAAVRDRILNYSQDDDKKQQTHSLGNIGVGLSV